MSSNNGKIVAIVSYLTIIGWIIAFLLHMGNKSSLGAFHLRQALGLMLTFLVFSVIPMIGWILMLVLLVFWVLALVSALQGQKTPLPIIGDIYQKMFNVLL